jgi:deoxyribose-phosphate aldolase
MSEALTQPKKLSPAVDVAPLIQHTNLRPEATRADIEQLLAECIEHGFHAAVVNPIWLPLAVRTLRGFPVKIGTALDSPDGGDTTATVARAASEARQAGAEEIDVMTKVGWLKSEMDVAYRQHLAAIVKAADRAPVKAILEAGLLTKHELALAVELCADAGVTYLKNSTGNGAGDATPRLVANLVRLAKGRMKVEAAGGITSLEEAHALLEAGADLLGTSAGVAIVTS